MMSNSNVSSSNPQVSWKLYPDEPRHNLDTLMAELLQRYMSEYTTEKFTSRDLYDQFKHRYISTYRCNNEPLRSHIDTIIEGYLQHLPLGTQSKLRELWQMTYESLDSKGAYCRSTYVLCQLSRERQQDGFLVTEGITLSIPLALLFTLVLQAIQDEDESAWPVPKDSTPEVEKARRMAQFDWINQHYFTTGHWSSRWPHPWLQLLNGYQGKPLQLDHYEYGPDGARRATPTPIDNFFNPQRQQQMAMLEQIYDETWQLDEPEAWANSFLDYWACAEKSQMEIIAARSSWDNTKNPDINIIQTRLLGILAMLHYRAETNSSEKLTQMLAQINTGIQASHTTHPITSSSSTSVQAPELALQASNLAQRLATKALLAEDSVSLVECVAHSPQMPAEAIAWLLSQQHNFNVHAEKETKGNDKPKTPLALACALGHTALVQHLLNMDTDKSAETHKLSAMRFAAHHRDPTIINLLYTTPSSTPLTDDDKQRWAVAYANALSEAAGRGHVDVFRELLQRFIAFGLSFNDLPLFGRPSVSYRGHYFGSLLLWAATCGHTDIVQSLLASDADMHKSGEENDICLTALSASASHGQVNSLRTMLEYAKTHGQMPDADYADLLVQQGIQHPAVISLLIEHGLFVFSGSAPGVGPIKFPDFLGATAPPHSSFHRNTASGAAHHPVINNEAAVYQPIVNLAPVVYRDIVSGLIEYIRARDALLPQPIADYLAEHGIIGYPKAVKLSAAHKMIAGLLIGDPDTCLNHLSENEHNALQQGKLGKRYQAYLQMQTQLAESLAPAPFSESQQLWPPSDNQRGSRELASTHDRSLPSSSMGFTTG